MSAVAGDGDQADRTRAINPATDSPGAAQTNAATSSDANSDVAAVSTTSQPDSPLSTGPASTGRGSEGVLTFGFSTTTPTTSNPTTTASAVAAVTSSAAPTSSSSSSSGGYSAGAIAGAAVGSAIGGALLAFLITFFLCGRRRRSNRNQSRTISHTGFSEKESRSVGAAAWQAHLPQGADDGALRNAAKTLFDQIAVHVDNFYQANDVRWDANTSQSVRQIDSGKLPAGIEELLQTPKTTLAVIKHCIAYDLILSISPSARPELSLLPPTLAVLPPKLQGEAATHSKDGTATRQAYGQWKLLNSFLFPSPKSDPAYKMDRDVSTSDVAELLCSAFLLWQGRAQNPEAVKQNAKGLASTAADLGVLIMSQASLYEFTWNASNSRQNASTILVTSPGFSKVADEQGKKVEPAQVLLPPDALRM